MPATQYLKEGDLVGALGELQEEVRNHPSDPEPRIFLFKLLCILGQWDRGLTQLNVAADLDPSHLLLAAMYRPILQCEAFREQVFEGKRTPVVFGEPPEWMGRLISANRLFAEGKHEQARPHFVAAFESAEPTGGRMNGLPFDWIGDSDNRLGPVLEAIVEGRYFWIPFSVVRELRLEPPTDLLDMVWTRVYFQWTNGGESPGFMPARYPHSHQAKNGAVALGRRTIWEERASGFFVGLGQRMLVTNDDEFPLLEIRNLVLESGIELGELGKPGEKSMVHDG